MSTSAFDKLFWKRSSHPRRPLRVDGVKDQTHFNAEKFARALDAHGEPRFEGTPREETIMLLRAAAEIEQQLMVQYLYTSWSLSADASQYDWSSEIRQVAKEEMGHLMTVQNLLLLLGDSPWLTREQASLANEPFPFMLEPLSVVSLSKFVSAESPDSSRLPADVLAKARPAFELAAKNGFTNERVGLLYAKIYWMFMSSDAAEGPWGLDEGMTFDSGHLGESDFSTVKLDLQNSSEDWPKVGNGSDSPPGLFVIAPKNRAEALEALHDISLQGEGLTAPSDDDDDSHFEKFLRIFDLAKDIASNALPVLKQPTNPTYGDSVLPNADAEKARITHPVAKLWAKLSDVHYAILLHEIALTLALPNDPDPVLLLRRNLCSHAVYVQMKTTLGSCTRRLAELPVKEKGTIADLAAAMPLSSPPMPPQGERKALVQSIRDLLKVSSETIVILKANDANHPSLTKIEDGNGKLVPIIDAIEAL